MTSLNRRCTESKGLAFHADGVNTQSSLPSAAMASSPEREAGGFEGIGVEQVRNTVLMAVMRSASGTLLSTASASTTRICMVAPAGVSRLALARCCVQALLTRRSAGERSASGRLSRLTSPGLSPSCDPSTWASLPRASKAKCMGGGADPIGHARSLGSVAQHQIPKFRNLAGFSSLARRNILRW